ncbi:inhibitor of growth protein 5-like [Pecten maximus]|uniref:inhibitor of growth protein 5-like n=1 Tax=Pecten maximus TaxID=6579 RepID=UPI00145836CD|nr:inhibitor of growth protein 5-like [Pecten maximus]
MATAMYLEHYLDSLESLPTELQRNFNLMRDLDQRSQDLMKDIDILADDYLVNVRGMTTDKRTEHLDSITNLYSKSKEFGDDKVQLAMQTYEMVDKHIRRLDADLARFEADLKERGSSNMSNTDSDSGKKTNKDKDKKRKSIKDKFEDEIPRKKKKKGQSVPEEDEAPTQVTIIPLPITHPSDVLDMPVDPNEPTYCLCHQVSYGEMIGCDNLECPIEWFHFACVGLKTKPKGKWYCPRCTEERKKK